ncbi:hypothetical protein [Gleimia hominis]|uniref:hypothetical protein n=1 Tax=Gleimia hominis TaxID=595468 RepID=UPI000C806181|nr:hypothetical protein [Gleimia hominis]WIK63786.1 hypothetical protein CJ187_005555 [Gleimia hominis]
MFSRRVFSTALALALSSTVSVSACSNAASPKPVPSDSNTPTSEPSQPATQSHYATTLRARAAHVGQADMSVDATPGLQFGAGVNGRSVRLFSVIDEPVFNTGDVMTARFALYDAKGQELSRAVQTQRFWDQATVIMSVLMKLPEDIDASSADVQFTVEPDDKPAPSMDIAARLDTEDTDEVQTTGRFKVRNAGALDATKTLANVICYNEKNLIVGGDVTHPGVIAAGHSRTVKAELVTTGTPARCEVFPTVFQTLSREDSQIRKNN